MAIGLTRRVKTQKFAGSRSHSDGGYRPRVLDEESGAHSGGLWPTSGVVVSAIIKQEPPSDEGSMLPRPRKHIKPEQMWRRKFLSIFSLHIQRWLRIINHDTKVVI